MTCVDLSPLDLFYQKAVRTDGPLHHLLLILLGRASGDGNQPVLVVVVFQPVLPVDSVLQNHLVRLARLVGGEGFGVVDRLIDVRRRINPPAVCLPWAWLLNASII